MLLVLAVCLFPAAGCHRSGAPAEAGTPTGILILPFDLQGEYGESVSVGRSVARAIALSLDQAENVSVLPVPELGEETGEVGATYRIGGTLTRQEEGGDALVRIWRAGEMEPFMVLKLSSDGENLDELSSRLARKVANGLHFTFPRLYDYQNDRVGGQEAAASPEGIEAARAWIRLDMSALMKSSTTLVARFPQDPAALYLNAWAYLYMWDGDPTQESLSKLRERLVALDRVDPESPYDELLRGYIYRSSGKPDWARRLYSQVLTRADLSVSTRAWALRQRSMTYLQLGNVKEARTDAQEAVRLAPASAASMFALSKSLEAEGRFGEAVAPARIALALDPGSWRQLQRLGLVLAKSGRYEEAEDAMRRSCELGGNQEACANLAVTLLKGGDRSQAAEAAAGAEELTDTSYGMYNMACYRALAGERSQALEFLGRSLDLGFSDTLLTTDPDLESLRSTEAFQRMQRQVEERLRSLQEISVSVFPWQA